MSLVTPPKVEKLRMALHAKAKEEPEFRFYQLYDKLYREDILEFAYRCSRSKKGGSGIDGVSFEQIESESSEAWLGKVMQELKQKTYKAEPLKRVWLDKPDGTKRPIAIPTIRDRVVQTAAMLVLAPIFEPRHAAGTVCVPEREKCARCGSSRAQSCQYGPYAGSGCGLVRLLRHDSSC